MSGGGGREPRGHDKRDGGWLGGGEWVSMMELAPGADLDAALRAGPSGDPCPALPTGLPGVCGTQWWDWRGDTALKSLQHMLGVLASTRKASALDLRPHTTKLTMALSLQSLRSWQRGGGAAARAGPGGRHALPAAERAAVARAGAAARQADGRGQRRPGESAAAS